MTLTGQRYRRPSQAKYRSRRYTPCSDITIGVPDCHFAARASSAGSPLDTAWQTSASTTRPDSGRKKCSMSSVASTASRTLRGVERWNSVSYTHLRAHETDSYLVCRLLLEKKKKK